MTNIEDTSLEGANDNISLELGEWEEGSMSGDQALEVTRELNSTNIAIIRWLFFSPFRPAKEVDRLMEIREVVNDNSIKTKKAA